MKRAITGVLFLLTIPDAGFGQAAGLEEPTVVTQAGPTGPVARVRLAFASAALQAREGEIDASLKTVRDLLAKGPPVEVSFKSLFDTLTGRGNSAANQAVEREVAQQLRAINRVWAEEKASADKVYEVFRDVVMPPARPSEFYRYPLAGMYSQSNSAGEMLVQRAVEAGREDDLKETIKKRAELSNQTDVRMLLMKLAVASDDFDAIVAEVESLADLLESATDETRIATAQALIAAISVALTHEDARLEILPVMEQVVTILQPAATVTGAWSSTARLLKLCARARYEESNPVRAAEHLRLLAEMYRQVNQTDFGRDNAYRYSRRFAEVAHEYLRGEQPAEALAILGEAADLPIPLRHDSVHDGLSSAVAGLNRQLPELEAEERYELLRKWTLPIEGRSSLRVLSRITPTEGPPIAFARVLGQRPQSGAFDTPEVAGIDGLFSSGWLLVQSAVEAGKLRGIIEELQPLADSNVVNAAHLLRLARIAAVNSGEPSAGLQEDLEQYTAEMQQRQPAAGQPALDVDLHDVVLAAACLDRPELREIGLRILTTQVKYADTRSSRLVRPWLYRTLAYGLTRRFPEVRTEMLAGSNLSNWTPASSRELAGEVAGAPRDLWLAHDGHVQHQSGPGNDVWCFRYPLTGEFEYSVDAMVGGTVTEGGVFHGGLKFEPWTRNQIVRIWGVGNWRPISVTPPVQNGGRALRYRKLTVRVSDDSVTFLINGRRVWEDRSRAHHASPWVGLAAYSGRVSNWRELQVTGEPVIPREVRLADRNSLRGWAATWFSEDLPYALPTPQEATAGLPQTGGNFDWQLVEGVILGEPQAQDLAPALPSLLSYFRPLQNGESVSYDFHYEPGNQVVHPAVGRLAFVLDPAGVRLKWLTSLESEWTGLPTDNELVEPQNRRGPRRLPLKPGDWNQVTLSLNADTVTVSLNGVEVYEREIDSKSDRRFGFARNRASAAAIRNVVLRGDWPEALSPELMANLIRNEDETTPDERRALGVILDDRHTADSALHMHRQAKTLPEAERFNLLSDWVLPGDDHDTFRLCMDYAATHPAPLLADDSFDQTRLNRAAELGLTRVETGGHIVAPALDLVRVARETGRLEELHQRVLAAAERPRPILTPEEENQHARSVLAIRILVDIERRDFQSVLQHFDRLFALVESAAVDRSLQDRWPETLAIHTAMRHPELADGAREIIHHVVLSHIRKGRTAGSTAWVRQMCSLMGLVEFLETGLGADTSVERPLEMFGLAPRLKQWQPGTRITASERGPGSPITHWDSSPDEPFVENLSGHAIDTLYFQSPLRGDFQVECDVTAFGWRDSHLMNAGYWAAPVYNRTQYRAGTFRRDWPRGAIEPRLMKPGETMTYRTAVKNGIVTFSVNGRLIHSHGLTEDFDPWLAIRSMDRNNTGVHNLRITGNPEIPDTINMCALEDLPNWHTYYLDGESDWMQRGDVPGGRIVGAGRPEYAGGHAERALFYHRPMLEDGTIEYDFRYEPGRWIVHPALDRLAMMLDPSGVKVHWVTDGGYDNTGLPPDNAFEEPENRRGPAELPLLVERWNHMALTLVGDVVQLRLNDVLIYERELERTNQRIFGFFYYADRSEARIRNLKWTGDWPKELPSLEEQELAGFETKFLDERLPELTAVFEHDFVKDGLPLNRFSIERGTPENFQVTTSGLFVDRPGGPSYHNATIAPMIGLQGDYDITVSYSQLRAQPNEQDGHCAVYLLVNTQNFDAGEAQLTHKFIRRDGKDYYKCAQGAMILKRNGETHRDWFGTISMESTAGRLRMARRGEVVYFLYAEGDSESFRLLDSRVMTDADVASDSVRLLVQTHKPGHTSVVWEDLTIRAEAMSGMALEDPAELLEEVNRQREGLRQKFTHDFTRDEFTEDRVYFWNQPFPLEPAERGVRAVHPGQDTWASCGLASQLGVRGDFDISVPFDVTRFDPPKRGKYNGVYLQIEFNDPKQTQINGIYRLQSDGRFDVLCQHRTQDDAGNLEYLIPRARPVSEKGISELRLARRGREVTCIYRDAGNGEEAVLARVELDTWDVPRASIRLMVHTGGNGLTSEVYWKSLTIHADEIIGDLDGIETVNP